MTRKITPLSAKRKIEMSIFELRNHFISICPSTASSTDKTTFNISFLRVKMSKHIFDHFNWLLNEDLAIKIGRGILSRDLTNRYCNVSLPSKVNGKWIYEYKFMRKCLISEVKLSLCGAFYKGNTQKKPRKNLDGFFFDVQSQIKNEKIRLICWPFRTTLFY